MGTASAMTGTDSKAPWHLWTVAVLTLLWNGSGAYTILMAQQGLLPDVSTDEAAYYAAQSLWFVMVTDIALFTPIAAAIALCMRSKVAVWLFALSLTAICITNVYDLVAGSSRALANTGALIVTCIIVVLAVLQLIYARVQRARGVLR